MSPLLQASNALGASESSDEDSDGSEGDGLTLLEIDYETVVDDEDLVDEFCVFKNTLEGIYAKGRVVFKLWMSSVRIYAKGRGMFTWTAIRS